MNNRNPFRRAISALLALALVLSLVPVRAMAAGQEVPVCGCESDDPSWHAPFCEAYVAPEDPQCLCVEQCAEGAANEWCEVCYLDPAACAASGEEEAAVYATVPTYISKIAVSYGAKESTPKDILRDNGFTIIDDDLNKGCGSTSHYIYMGYKTTTDPSQAITGIFFSTDKNKPNTATFDGVTANLLGGSGETNPGENKAVDLNSDASGSYIYTYVTRNTSRAPLTEIVIDASSSKSGYVTPNVNLNQGTSGGSIYLHYKQFSATVSATYHYLNASGSRTSSTQSGTVKTHLEQMTKVPSYANSVTYDGRTFKFLGWRDDNTAGAAEETSPFATYMTGTKTYRAVYQGNVTVSFDANGGTGAPSAVTDTQYINAGTSSVSKGNVSVTIPSGSCTHPTKCNLLGWSTGKTATSATYQPGGSITVSSNTTLYAVYGNHSYNDKGICTACSGLDHTCQYSANGFCTRCDGYQPAVLKDGYYQIANGGNLFWFAKHINTVDRTANAKLTADINLEGRLWTPIGFTGETNNNFRGHFDGQGHTITGLNVEGGRSGLGFFGEVRLGTVENFTIYGEVKLIGKYDYVGGVIGSAPGVNENKPDHNGATIRNITSYVNVTLGAGSHGSNRVGGFIGYANHKTLIENCAWYGTLDLDIYRAQDGVGGLLGKANDNSAVTIRNCGAYGTIRTAYKSGSYDNFDTIFIGGIVSNSVASAKTTIKNTLWAGKIVNETNLGTKAHIAAFGTLNGIDSVTDCYALDNAPYLTTNDTQDSYITSVTTAQLASGEVAYKLGAAWGQTIGTNDYPVLGGEKVYHGYVDCSSAEKIYSNSPLSNTAVAHSYDNGFCTICGGFQPATGSGTPTSPYKIGNAGQLYWFAAVVNAGYGGVVQNAAAWAELTDNITVNADVLKEDGTLNGDGSGFLPWTPIGNGDSSISRYTGTFNGNGKTVSGLYVNGNTSNVGLFGYLMGTVKNVGVVDSYLSGSKSNVGGVVGKNDEGTITGCYNEGTVSSIFRVGGVVGNNNGTVEDCYNTGTVSGSDDYVGGVVGQNDGTVEDCYNTGTVSGSKDYVGGVVGNNNGTVEDCYNTGTVSGSDDYVGGVVGQNDKGTITGCYNEGTVSGIFRVGGVVGFNNSPCIVANCYNEGTVSGSDYIGGVVGYNNRSCIVANCYNAGTVSGNRGVGGVAGLNDGTVANCYYDSDIYGGTATDVWGKPTADFASGAVTYSLSQGCTVGEGEAAVTYSGDVWGQNIDGTGDKDAYPVFSDAKIYQAKNCNGDDAGYSNTDGKQLDHTYENGFCTVCDGFQSATGSGTESDPYKISNAGQLYWFAAKVNDGDTDAWAVLTADIVVNENVLKEDGTLSDDSGDFRAWTTIGKDAKNMYTGTFDGNGKTVSGLYFDGNTNFVGLFGAVYGGTVKNVGVVDSYFCSSFTNGDVGGVVGFNNIGTVENCYNAGAVKSSGTLGRVGGVVGSDSIGTIKNCYNTGAVSGEGSNNYVGGVVGYIGQSTVENCYNTGAVRKPSALGRVGGVVGYVSGSGTIKNCYNRGAVISTSLGAVAGGVLGNTEAQTVTVENCYYDSTVYNGDAIGGTFGGTATNVEGKTTDQFKSGEVAYLLQGEQTQQVWGQNIDGEGEKDAYPLFSDAKVYRAKNCKGETVGYSNTDGKQLDHTYNDNGFCSLCGGYEPAELVNGYYEISNAGQLYWFAKQVNDGQSSINGKLTANITVNENVLNADGTLNGDGSNFNPWTPIGSHYNKYTGTFDGDNHILSGLYFNDTRSGFLGLFGSIGDGNVKNVHVMNSYFGGMEYVGGIAGYSDAGTITNCYNSGTVSGNNCVGGVIGYSYGAVLTGCHSEGTISGNSNVGGVVGYNNYGSTVTDCSNTATINGKYNVGGVVGYGEESSAENCYNTGAVNGNSYVGGVAGRNESGPIMCCYNTGTVNSNDYVGGVVGFNDYAGDVTNCYNTGAVSGSDYVGGVAGFNFTNITNCYYDSTVYSDVAIGSNRGAATNVEGKTSEEFASGHVAYLLSRGCTVGETVYSGEIWGQNIDGEGEKDAYPVFSDAKVYPAKNCDGSDGVYSNTQDVQKDHIYSDNGFCTFCKGYQPATGDGTQEAPYKIGNAGQLYWFAAEVNDGDTDAWAVLTANITVNTGDVAGCNGTKAEGWKDWTPIGKDYDTQYVGIFDGKEFTVSGLYFNNSDVSYVGLFRYSGGTVKNVGIVASYFHGNECVGGVVGNNSGTTGTVESCYNTGTVSGSGDEMIGGVVGNNEGTVEGCYNAGPVSGTGTGTRTGIGGVTGYNYGTVEGCYNAGLISGSSKVGGVVGFNVKGTMVCCYNIGTVSGRYAVGGVVGDNTGGDRRSVVTNCYNTGAVSASGESVGGVAGSNGGDISCCYSTGTVSGRNDVGGVVGYNGAGFTVINSYNNSDAFSGESIGLNDGTAVDVLNKTGAQFASGEVTYLLQGEQTQQVWGQNVDGEGEKDPYPIFSEVKVYPVSCCPGEYGGYSNTEGKQQAPKYNENGFCIYCGGYESAKGRGTEADPYQISNAGQLYWFAAVVNTGYGDVVMNDSAWAELTANITVNEAVLKADGSLNDGTFQAWTPISGLEVHYFGTFDGNGFAVSGLYFHDTTAKYAGLFGVLEGDAVVRNVGVVDSYISGGICVGAVAGANMGTVEGCYNAGTIIAVESEVGGIVGQNHGSVTNCYNTGAVSGVSYVGGIVGQNHGFLTNCYNAGPVSGSGERIGGVTGFNVGSVTNCYYDSTVYSGEAFGNSYGTATKVEGKSTAEFASGAVTYSLSQGCTVGETTYSGDVWGQNIDGDDKDAYPLFSNAKVYFGYYDCLGSYTNNASVSQVKPEHSGQLTYADNGDDATHTVNCDTCGDVVDASQIHSYGEDHKCLCGAVEEVLSVTISWGGMAFVYTEEAGWNNPDSAWVKTENTGNLQISVTYTYETDRTDIAGIFSNGTNSAAGTAVILPEQTYQVWLRLEGKPGEVLDNAVIGTVKVTVG